jgi:hypothetical protein
MKNKHGFILGFSIMLTMTIITMAGCASLSEMFKSPEFPSDFSGTWERVDQSIGKHTLTLTSTTLKASNQTYYWNLRSISGDIYYISVSTGNTGANGTIKLTLNGDYLNIIDNPDSQNASDWVGTENDWTGTWKRK